MRRQHQAVRRAIRGVVEQLERRVLLAVGPDPYGYVADAHPFENIDLKHGDAGVVFPYEVDLAASSSAFNYYGRSFASPIANSKGLVSFDSSTNSYQPGKLASAPFPAAIAPYWLNYRSSVLAKLENTTGDAKPDRLIYQYLFFEPGIKLQVILQLNTGDKPGDIIFNYVDLDPDDPNLSNGAQATVGIKDAGYNSNRLLIATNQSHPLVGSSKAIRISNAATGQPHADAGGITTAAEGATSVVIDGTGSNDPNQSSASLQFAWDFDTDGIYGETGSAASFGNETGSKPSFTVGGPFDGPNRYPIVLRVTDSSGVSSYDEGSVVVDQGIPTVSATGPTTATVGVPITYHLTGSDPNPGDARGLSINWGDDTQDSNLETSADFDESFTHVYDVPGTYTLEMYAYQNDGQVSEKLNRTVTVAPPPDLQLSNGVLLVSTGAGNDTIVLDQQGANLRLNRAGSITTYLPAQVTTFRVYSGGGNDAITVSVSVAADLFGQDGDDTITAGGGVDSIDGGAGNDSIIGGDGKDSINAQAGDDSVNGGLGDDFILGGEGADTIDGGGDRDEIYDYFGPSNVRANGGRIVTGEENDTIVGGNNAVSIYANDGNDSILTGSGNDTIEAQGGDDTVVSGLGDDCITSAGGNDSLIGGAGNDDIFASNGSGAPAGPNTYVEGGSGDDVLFGWMGTVNGGAGHDRIFGGEGADVFGGDGDDEIRTRKGEILDGGAGNDTLSGGIFDDDAFDSVLGGDGDDEIIGYHVRFIDGGSGNDFIRANGIGGAGVEVHGGDGTDRILANEGRDSIYGGAGGDTVHGGDASDLISGGGGNDRLFGQGGHDRLYGGDGEDNLAGQGGNDRLRPGPTSDGADTLAGGLGSDWGDDDDADDLLAEIENILA